MHTAISINSKFEIAAHNGRHYGIIYKAASNEDYNAIMFFYCIYMKAWVATAFLTLPPELKAWGQGGVAMLFATDLREAMDELTKRYPDGVK